VNYPAPEGWLLCDGRKIDKTQDGGKYAKLVDLLQKAAGSNQNHPYITGCTTDQAILPDLRGIFLKGAGTTTRTAGKDASGNPYAGILGVYSLDQMQGHKHSLYPTNFMVLNVGGSSSTTNGSGAWANLYVGTPTNDGTNGDPRTGNTTEPQSLGVNYIIKY
jgi:microcystin-dependent protein